MLFCGIISPVERQPPTTRQILTEWEFPIKNEPIRGCIMTIKISILNLLNHLNSSLNEEFYLYNVSLTEISFFSEKSNLLIKIERFYKNDECLKNIDELSELFYKDDECFKYIVRLYELHCLNDEITIFNLKKYFETTSFVNVEDIIGLIKNEE